MGVATVRVRATKGEGCWTVIVCSRCDGMGKTPDRDGFLIWCEPCGGVGFDAEQEIAVMRSFVVRFGQVYLGGG